MCSSRLLSRESGGISLPSYRGAEQRAGVSGGMFCPPVGRTPYLGDCLSGRLGGWARTREAWAGRRHRKQSPVWVIFWKITLSPSADSQDETWKGSSVHTAVHTISIPGFCQSCVERSQVRSGHFPARKPLRLSQLWAKPKGHPYSPTGLSSVPLSSPPPGPSSPTCFSSWSLLLLFSGPSALNRFLCFFHTLSSNPPSTLSLPEGSSRIARPLP